MSDRRRLAPAGAWLLVLGVALAVPFSFGDQDVFQLARVLALAIAIGALCLLTGHSGQVSVGHGALMGVGAYATAILMTRSGLPYPVAILAGALLCAAIGLAIGVPALRIRGLYLALLTLALAILLPAVAKEWVGLTGGVFGLTMLSPEAPGALNLTSPQWLYLVNLAVLVVVLLLLRNLTRGPHGRALDAIRSHETLAAAQGVDVARTKVLVFGLSAGLAGLAGGLYQLLLGTVTPDTYTLTLSLTLLTGAILGGIRTLGGALVGAAFVVYVPEWTASVSSGAPLIAYAIALLLAVYFLPDGLASAPRRVRALVARIRTSHTPPRATRGRAEDAELAGESSPEAT